LARSAVLGTTPQQMRSRTTLERLLRAADVAFAERGIAATTTTTIADRAGVSVGALYRFFPDKHAIAAALADRYLAEAQEIFGPVLASVRTPADVRPAVHRLLVATVDLQSAHAGYYRIAQDQRPDDVDSPGRRVRLAFIESFDAVLERIGVGSSTETRRLVLGTAIETIRHTLVLYPPGHEFRSQVLVEIETMVIGYLVERLDLV
jgi:AcrR family transcriptional regulator